VSSFTDYAMNSTNFFNRRTGGRALRFDGDGFALASRSPVGTS